jgi:membrane protein required for colicin V production
MLIDLGFMVLMLFAVFKGISKGFIVAVFSFLAFIVGMAAAVKLSATVAEHLEHRMGVAGYWLPFLSFIIVFAGVVLLVRLGASIVKKAAGVVFLGWVDALLGILLYAALYLMIYSVVLFFATRIYLVSGEAQQASKTYSFIAPFGPKVIGAFGKVIPFFSNMFSQLSHFFEGFSKKA